VAEAKDGYAGTCPFAVTHRVGWGDCDPAGIIYTPRVLDYAMETLEAWCREVLGVPWLKLNREMSMGAPTVRVEIDFLGAPGPDQLVITELRVENLGNSSVTYRVAGHDGNGREFYRARLVSCFVTRPAFEATPVPDDFRRRILAYQKACGDA
jgi:4-hydroxybenzoyl-CoA thioesterase